MGFEDAGISDCWAVVAPVALGFAEVASIVVVEVDIVEVDAVAGDGFTAAFGSGAVVDDKGVAVVEAEAAVVLEVVVAATFDLLFGFGVTSVLGELLEGGLGGDVLLDDF